MDYKLKTIEFHNGNKKLVIYFADSQKDGLDEFLNTEATQFTDSILKYIDKVLSGESDYEEFNGNRCSIEIRKDQTLVEDLFEGMYDDFDTFPTYEISTQELRDLIVMWVKKVEEFKKEHGYE